MKECVNMQRVTGVIIMLIPLLVAVPSRSQAGAGGDIAAVKHVEQSMGSAMVAGDMEALKQIYADDFAAIGSDGTLVTKTALLSYVGSSRDRLEWFADGPIDVEVFGDVALAQGLVEEKRSSGSGREADSRSVWQDLLEKRGGRWVVRRSAGTKVASGRRRDRDPAVVAVIENFENRLGKAMVANNLDQIARAYADDWVTVTATGKVFTKGELLQDFRSGNHKLLSFQNGPMNVQVFGDVAVVQTSVAEKRMQDGKNISGLFAFMDLLERRGGHWVIVRTSATRTA